MPLKLNRSDICPNLKKMCCLCRSILFKTEFHIGSIFWTISVLVTTFGYYQFKSFRITGYVSTNVFESESLFYSLIEVLNALNPIWFILVGVALLYFFEMLKRIFFNILSDLGKEKFANVFKALFLLIVVAITFSSVITSYMIKLLSSLIFLSFFIKYFCDKLNKAIKGKKDSCSLKFFSSGTIILIVFLPVHLILMINSVAAFEYESNSFSKRICSSLKAIIVRDYLEVQHVGFYLHSDKDYITIKRKSPDGYFDYISFSSSSIKALQNFSLEFEEEKKRAFVECQ